MRTPFLGGVAALGACAAAAVLGGCGSGSASTSSQASATASSTSTTTSTTTSSTTVTTSASPTVAGSSTAATASAASVPPGCVASQIEVVLGPSQAGLGHVGFVLTFHNSGSSTCTLTGYPGAALVSRHGAQLQIPRSPNGYLGGLASQDKHNPVVRVAPGKMVSALLEGEDFDNKTQKPCPRYLALLVTPPNQTDTRRLDDRLSICAPTIHPVVAGTTGREG